MTDVIKLAEKMATAAARATPGEWFAEGFIVDDGIGADIAVVSRRTPTVINPEQFDRKANAAFIAIANPLNVEKVTAALKSFHSAFEGWQDKTEWVQEDRRFDVLKPWGMHRADVLKAYIEHLEARIEELEESHAQVIQSRDHYKRMTKEGLKQLAESRTVKLPKLKMLEDYLAEVAVEERKQILVGVKLEFHRALTAAGIKVERE